MFVLIAALVSGSAHADPIILLPGGGCGFRPPPCLGILIGGEGSIMPPDWYELEARSLGDYFDWYRVELTADTRELGFSFNGFELGEKAYSSRESDERTSVYYVPAMPDMRIEAWGDERAQFEISITGAFERTW